MVSEERGFIVLISLRATPVGRAAPLSQAHSILTTDPGPGQRCPTTKAGLSRTCVGRQALDVNRVSLLLDLAASWLRTPDKRPEHSSVIGSKVGEATDGTTAATIPSAPCTAPGTSSLLQVSAGLVLNCPGRPVWL